MTDISNALTHLGQRREAIAESLVLDLPLPRWEDPEIHVLYRPVDLSPLRKSQQAVVKAKGDKAQAELNNILDVLIGACDGIYAPIEGERYSLNPDAPEGDLTRFDDDLGKNLGMAGAPARAICRQLFINDGDVLAHFVKLCDWSGYTDVNISEELSGE